MDGENQAETTSSTGNGEPPAVRLIPPVFRRTWVHKSATAVILDADASITGVLGWTPDDLKGKTSLDFIHPDDQALAVENWMQMLGTSGGLPPLRLRHRHQNGSWKWVELTNHNLLDDQDRSCVLAEMVEIPPESMAEEALARGQPSSIVTGERPLQLHEALRAREQLLHRLSEALPVGVLHVDIDGRILYTNQRLHAILDKARSATLLEQFSTVVAADTPHVIEAFETALSGGLDNDIEVRISGPEATGDKDVRQCTLSIRTLSDETGDPIGAVACLVDMTESVRMREELRIQATFDTLTTCYNRASTIQELTKLLADLPSGGSPAVIFIDLDGFKSINDHLGHGAGDRMLEIVARRLRGAVRGSDFVGRIGGDEFLVVCPGIRSNVEALRAATRMSDCLRRPVKLPSAEVSCRASVGVAWSAGGETDPDTLIGQADSAMYEAKRSGLGRPVLYRTPV